MKNVDIPGSVNNVRWLLLLYAGAVLLGTLAFAMDTGFMEKREFLRGLVRVAGISYLAWWLPSLDRRAWWVSTLACGILAAIGIGTLMLSLIAGGANGLTLWAATKVALPIYALTHAFIILMRRETRVHFAA